MKVQAALEKAVEDAGRTALDSVFQLIGIPPMPEAEFQRWWRPISRDAALMMLTGGKPPGSHHPYLCPVCGAQHTVPPLTAISGPVVTTAGEMARAVWVRTPGVSDYLVVFCASCWLDQGAPPYIERDQ